LDTSATMSGLMPGNVNTMDPRGFLPQHTARRQHHCEEIPFSNDSVRVTRRTLVTVRHLSDPIRSQQLGLINRSGHEVLCRLTSKIWHFCGLLEGHDNPVGRLSVIPLRHSSEVAPRQDRRGNQKRLQAPRRRPSLYLLVRAVNLEPGTSMSKR